MDVFITGASGYVGGVVAEHLLAAGHQVSALARSDAAAARVTALGATAVRGDLLATDVLRDAADRAGAVVHTAVDYTDPTMADAEATGLRALLDGAAGKPFVYTSTGLVYPGGPETAGVAMTEDSPADASSAAQPHKLAGERLVLDAPDVQGVVLRASLVHGRGGSGLLIGLQQFAQAAGFSLFVGDGAQTWSAVHVDDLAELFTLAVKNPVPGVYNATADDTFTIRALAEAIGARTGKPANGLPLEQVLAVAAPLAVLARAGELDGSRARATYGWAPKRRGLLEDLASSAYGA